MGVSSIASSGRANDVVVGVGDTATTCREWNSRKNDTARSYSCCCCSLVAEVAEEEDDDDDDDDMVTLPRFFVCITIVVYLLILCLDVDDSLILLVLSR